MSKLYVRLSYKEIQIIKHSLGHYLHRENRTDKEFTEEERLLMKITNEVDVFRERNNIQ